MNTTTHHKLTRDALDRVLPEVFSEQLPRDVAEPITVVVFRERVVTGRLARKAIERAGTDFGASLVFAARDFTRDATELAAAHGIIVLTKNGTWGGYLWSDERLVDIRTSIATHRPMPLPPS